MQNSTIYNLGQVLSAFLKRENADNEAYEMGSLINSEFISVEDTRDQNFIDACKECGVDPVQAGAELLRRKVGYKFGQAAYYAIPHESFNIYDLEVEAANECRPRATVTNPIFKF